MAKRGPKLITLNWDELDKLCALQCTLAEMSLFFEVSADSIERVVLREKKMKFAAYFAQKAMKGKVALRRKIFAKALSGDNTMLIWASKNILNWSDKFESRATLEHSGSVTMKVDAAKEAAKKIIKDPEAFKAIETLEKTIRGIKPN